MWPVGDSDSCGLVDIIASMLFLVYIRPSPTMIPVKVTIEFFILDGKC